MDKLQGSKYFTAMDIQLRYNSICIQKQIDEKDQPRTIWTNYHVLWNVQQSCNILNNNEHNICTAHCQKPHTSLYEWHSHPHSNKETTPQDDKRSTENTLEIQPLSQAREMWIHQETVILSWIYHLPWSSPNGPDQTQRNS